MKLPVTARLTISEPMLKVCEIFKSIQGESTAAGCICSFVRLSGCNLKCLYCDTSYALTEGRYMSVEEISNEIDKLGARMVEITGGEPLVQDETPQLCRAFIDKGYKVLVETNGSLDISKLPPQCMRIVDIKCPGSGNPVFLDKNFSYLTSRDECKFVISSRSDFDWALDIVRKRKLSELLTVIFSPNTNEVDPAMTAEWIIAENAPVRLGLQLHKIIWGNRRGV